MIGLNFYSQTQARHFSKLWEGIVGDGGLIDLIFSPIDKALKWVMGVFWFLNATRRKW